MDANIPKLLFSSDFIYLRSSVPWNKFPVRSPLLLISHNGGSRKIPLLAFLLHSLLFHTGLASSWAWDFSTYTTYCCSHAHTGQGLLHEAWATTLPCRHQKPQDTNNSEQPQKPRKPCPLPPVPRPSHMLLMTLDGPQ